MLVFVNKLVSVNMNKPKIKFKFTLCNPPKCGCPDVLYEDGIVTIYDDHGGTVKLTLDELEDTVDRTKNLLQNITEDIEYQEESKREELEAKKEAILEKQRTKKNK